MSNKIKKLICSLLAAAMLVTSAGVVSMAAPEGETAATETTVTETAGDSSTADQTDEEKETPSTEATETTAEATEAPAAAEATEAPVAEATAAPVVDTGSAGYENDDYYEKSLALCSSLGIISGFEDGSVKPEEKVTRAQMASIVLRMLALDGTSPYQNIFTDVDSSHWAANQIQSAYEASIVSGMGDGTFAPDAEVTYAQVIVMLVNAMNYREDAEYYGGWQQGYIKEAGELELLKNAPGSADVASDRGVVIKMVYNALLADYKEVRTYDEYGQPKYSTDKTLAEVKFDVIEAKGLLIGTNKTTIGDKDIQEGQIEIKKDKENNSEVYNTILTDLDDYIARKVTYYYKENAGLTAEVLAITYDASKSETYEIDPDDIDNVTYDGGVVSIKVNKVSKEKKSTSDAKIIYNGKLTNDITVEDFQPEKGKITMIKSDKNEVDDYDVVFVDSYETLIVTSANDDRIIGKIQDPEGEVGTTTSVTITIDDKVDRTITVKKMGEEIRARNLKKNDVATVRASIPFTNPEVLDIVVTGESITGSVSSMSKELNDSSAKINGDDYGVANVAVGDLKTGAQGTFYLDMFGRIGYIDSAVAGRLESGEKYGWIISQYKGEGTSDQIVKIMSQEGKVEEFTYASNVDYWAPSALVKNTDKAGVSKTKTQMETIVADIFANDGFAHMWNDARQTTGSATHFDRPHICTPGASIRLVKYKANSSGKLTRLYFAVNAVNLNKWLYEENYDASYGDILDSKYITDPYLSDADLTALKNSDALIFDQTNKSGSTLVGGLLGGYNLTDNAVEFDVPDDETKYTNETSYVVGPVNSSRYNVRENGVGDKYIFADFDGTTPAVLIKFVSDPDSAVNPTDLDTASNIATIVVDKISQAIDADDETVYVINGYTSGTDVSVTTKTTSALADITGYTSSSRKYAISDVIWDGKDGGDNGDNLANYLHKGDIIVTDGNSILRFYSAQQVYEDIKSGKIPSKTITTSETRNNFYFGPVTDSDIDDISWMSINGQMFSLDAGAVMDVIEIDMDAASAASAVKISDDLATVSDVEVYSEDADEFDLAMARTASKGSLQEVVIYRVKNYDGGLN